MSRDNLAGLCGGYKGIENFLRRLAFNLGNTPSETEVKIISCIPIDVTDLQQKIADLEKQLEAAESPPPCPPCPKKASVTRKPSVTKKPSVARKSSSSKPRKPGSRPTSRTVVAHPALYGKSSSKQDSDCSQKSKTEFDKGSNFSIHFDCPERQTRKSIISFIYPTCPEQNCNIVAEVSNLTKDKYEKLKDPKKSFFSKKCRTSKKKNKTQLVYYAKPDNKTPFNNYALADDATSKNAHREELDDCNDDVLYFSHILNKQYMPRPAFNDVSNISEFSSPVCRDVPCRAAGMYESDVCSCCRGPFQNLDQHMGPAHRFDLYPTFTDKENDNKYAYYDSSAYDVIPVKEKNYKIADDFDVLNRRDFRRHIDMKCWPEKVRAKKLQPVVPTSVREEKRKPRVIVNYHNVAPIRNNLDIKTNKRNTIKDIVLNKMAARRPIVSHSLNLNRNSEDPNICDIDFGDVYAKHNRQKLISVHKPVKLLHNVSCSTTILNNSECQTGMEESENFVEDKTAATLNQIKAILQSVLTEVKTKGKLTNHPEPKKDAVVQNGLSQSNICGGSHLLNSFTYSHYNTNPYIASCSRQMPSTNYCPPTVPYNGAKCFQQYPLFVEPNRHLCTTCCKLGQVAKQPKAGVGVGVGVGMGVGVGVGEGLSRMPAARHAISAATNTDQRRDRSQETQKLIKDIYDSLALNIEIPTKDTPFNQGDQVMNPKAYVMKTDPEREMNRRANLISEIFKNSNPLNSSITEKMTPLSKLTSNDTTFRSGYSNIIRAPPMNKHIVDNNTSIDDTTVTGETEPAGAGGYREDSDEQSDDTAPAGDEDADPDADATATATASSTADDADDTEHASVAAEQSSKKQGKKGILSKMLKLFTQRNRRQPKKSIKEQNESESDSDDYQTVYSQKVPARPKKEVRKLQEVRKVHYPLPTKAINSKHQRMKQRSPERYRRAPYMEQEYRRYWDEKLLFQERYAKRSTEESRVTSPQAAPRSAYHRKYEARSVLVEPRRAAPPAPARVRRRSSYVAGRAAGNKPRPASRGLAWLKKHKLDVHCGEQWKKLILEG